MWRIQPRKLIRLGLHCFYGIIALGLLTFVCFRLHLNLATVGFLYLIVVLVLSLSGEVISSVIASIIGGACLSYFFAPPLFSFREEPLDIVAIAAFVTTSLVVSGLVSKTRAMSKFVLSSVDRRLIDATEQERSRIGRELHDDINQRLAMLAIELEQLRQNPAEARKSMEELQEEVVEISNDVQALSHELHSTSLEHLGLVSGLQSWCQELSGRRSMEISFSSNVVSSIPPEIGLCLFRVVQEALHNAIKHSGEKRIEVHLSERSGQVHLRISDTGRGFDCNAARKGTGLGLTSMQERVRLVNGTILIQSKPMGGTTIHVSVAFQQGGYSAKAVG